MAGLLRYSIHASFLSQVLSSRKAGGHMLATVRLAMLCCFADRIMQEQCFTEVEVQPGQAFGQLHCKGLPLPPSDLPAPQGKENSEASFTSIEHI